VRARFFGIALATVILIASAYGDAIFTTGNHPQPNEQNILFHADETGMVIDGFTNQSQTDVKISSTTDVLIGTGGQSDIDAQDGELNNVTFKLVGATFLDFILDPQKLVANNDLKVTVQTNTGPFTFTYGDIHGNNFLTITTINGEVIDSVTVDSASGFAGFKQPRISGVAAVPEPSSMLLLGSGLLGVAMVVRRKLC
jgi:hypothetical protein